MTGIVSSLALPVAEAKQTKLTVSFSTGMKANIGNYESQNAELTRTEEWDVTGLLPVEVDKLWTERFGRIKEQLDEMILHDYEEVSIFALASDAPPALGYVAPEEHDSIGG